MSVKVPCRSYHGYCLAEITASRVIDGRLWVQVHALHGEPFSIGAETSSHRLIPYDMLIENETAPTAIEAVSSQTKCLVTASV